MSEFDEKNAEINEYFKEFLKFRGFSNTKPVFECFLMN